MNLYSAFEKVIQSFGMQALTHPIFYNANIGIRFNIGDNGHDVYLDNSDLAFRANPSYVSCCLSRAKRIYTSLNNAPDILVIEGYLGEDETTDAFVEAVVSATDLPQPQEIHTEKICDGEDEFVHIFLCWQLKRFDPHRLLTEIIIADLGTGRHFLTSSVYFVCTNDNVLFHLYDDRGADLCAEKTESISHVYKALNDLILDYDREKIDSMFKAE